MGADIKEVAQGLGYDPRIGHSYLEAGMGFGGPCLEKDLSALINIAEGNGYDPQLLRAILERNERQIGGVVTKLKQLVGQLLYKKTIAVLGLSFKAGTSDVRNSLALKVIDHLEKDGAIVRAHDPVAIPEVHVLKPDLTYCQDPYEAVEDADALLILTEWPSFKDLDYGRIKALMELVRQAAPLPYSFHAHQRLLAEPGGALVRSAHRKAVAPGRASEQRRTGGCHLPLPGRHQRRPQALRMDQDR